jgi:ElaA protein
MPEPAAPSGAPAFRWARLEDLSGPEVHALLSARERVFVVEQACAYREADDLDPVSWHLTAHVDGTLAACARVVDPGRKYDAPSIGRVMTVQAFRGRRLGEALMREAIDGTRARFPGQAIRISAQAYLLGFYNALGFEVEGEPYLEDGIAHIGMRLAPVQARPAAPA